MRDLNPKWMGFALAARQICSPGQKDGHSPIRNLDVLLMLLSLPGKASRLEFRRDTTQN